MIAQHVDPITARLVNMLRGQHDERALALRVTRRPNATGGIDLEILRHDGSELSDAETAHVRGVIAAHNVEPL